MKIYFFIWIFVIFSLNSYSQDFYKFNDVRRIKSATVKNQQRTGTCWCFATTSFLESELLRKGYNIDLSEGYFVRQAYVLKAENFVFRQGKISFSEGGLAHDVFKVFETFGAMPEQSYQGFHFRDSVQSDDEVTASLSNFLSNTLKNKLPLISWENSFKDSLDVYLGKCPESVEFEQKKMSPLEFAHELPIHCSDYVSLASFSHHPFYNQFVLEIPDNSLNGIYLNLPLDDLMQVVDSALYKGYTIVWDGDTRRSSFLTRKGLAIMPVKADIGNNYKIPVLEQSADMKSRQQNFQTFHLQDIHLMHIVGNALDAAGNKYYIIKNSYGEVGPYNGYLYMSESYFKSNTISITLNKEGLPIKIKHMGNLL